MFLIFSKLVTVGSMQHSQKVLHECYWNCQFQVTYYVNLLTICCNFLSLKFSGYLTGQHMNKYSNVIIIFSIIMNLNRLDGKPHLTAMIWIYFAKFINILTCVFDDHAPIKKLLKKEKPLTFHWQTVNWFLLATFNAHQGYLLYEIL